MGDAAFRTGWRVFRDRYRQVVPPARRRQRFRIALSAAVLGGAVSTITLAVWGWASTPPPVAGIGVVLLAAAAGTFAGFLCRVGGSRTDWAFTPTGDWRREERVRRQFAARPPAIEPADRDLVLAAAQRSRDPLVAWSARTVLVPVYWACAGAGLELLTLGSGPSVIAVLAPLMVVLQSSTLVASVTSLGRAELARRRAEAMPTVPPTAVPRTPRGRGPSGTKVGLPGD